MNKVSLLGRIATDLEVKCTVNGTSVCRFTMAVSRRFKNADGKYDADFISCVAWRDTADFIFRNFSKGRMIAITGEIHSSVYEKDGRKMYSNDIYVDEAYFTGEKPNAYKEQEDVFAAMEREHMANAIAEELSGR